LKASKKYNGLGSPPGANVRIYQTFLPKKSTVQL
jgi:hypothetical protein